MQFAYSPCSDALLEVMQKTHDEDEKTGQQWLALLDGSMLNAARLATFERQFATRASMVFDGTRLENFGRQGPLIFTLPPISNNAIKSLVRLCNAIPALSFVVPRQDAAQVEQALSWLAMACTDDGTELHCRFADTRITPHLLDALTPEQRAQVSAAIQCWSWPDRQGHDLASRAFVQTAHQPDGDSLFNQPFTLDTTQFAQVLHAAEADMVFQMLVERMPDLLPSQPGGQIHTRIARMLVAAHTRGLQDLPDLFQWVVIGLSTCDTFDQSPALTPVWQKYDPTTQSFGDCAQQWPEHVWHALGTAQHVPA